MLYLYRKTHHPSKLENIHNYHVALEFYATDCIETDINAREYARQKGMTYISQYNDQQVIEGQGTIALELTRQLENIDAVFVSIDGGGLISGVAGYLKRYHRTRK